MTLEKIKREFVKYMEDVRSGDPYPRKFFGCLISVILEQGPVSQERIMELTGYSQATISLTFQKLLLLFPIRVVKIRGDRKRYYNYEGTPGQFILDLWEKRLDVSSMDILQFDTMIDRVKDVDGGSSATKRFLDYLQNMKMYLNLLHTLRTSGIEQFRHVLETGLIESLDFRDAAILEKGELSDFLDGLRKTSISFTEGHSFDEGAVSDSLRLKNDFFSGIKVNLNPFTSQATANNMMVIHNIVIEGRTTQDMIEKSTLLPRSTISEILTQSVKLGIIKVTKNQGSRIKFYQLGIPFIDLILANFDRPIRQSVFAMERLSEFIKRTRKVSGVSQEKKKFLEVLNRITQAYSFLQEFTNSMKVDMVLKLKEEFERGFVFI